MTTYSTATLTVPEEAMREATVRLEIDLSLQDAADLETALLAVNKMEGEGVRWYGRFIEIHSLATTLKDLREQAEKTISGLKFTPAVSEGTSNA